VTIRGRSSIFTGTRVFSAKHHTMRSLALLLPLLPLVVGAQIDYLANDPVWRVSAVCSQAGMGGGPCITTDTYNYVLDGDTLIDGFTYQKVARAGTVSALWTGMQPAPLGCMGTSIYSGWSAHPIRQEGRAFHIWDGDSDELLFDFDLEVGDMLPLTANNYDPQIEVTDLDSIQLNGEWRRVYTVNGGWVQTIVEGIGSDRGLFEPITPEFECAYMFECFGTNGVAVYPDPGPDCTLALGVDGIRTDEARITFDEASAMLHVSMPNAKERVPLDILDTHGRLCVHTQFSGSSTQLDLAALANGAYLVRIGAHTERLVVARN
jgi:hypothetical protein